MAQENIKLFVDAHSFDTEFQGTQTFIQGLYTAFMDAYPEVEVYFGCERVDYVRSCFCKLPAANVLPYKKGRGVLRYVLDIPALIKQHRFTHAHFQYIAPPRQKGCTYIVTLHDLLFNDFPASFPRLYRLSRNLLFGNSIRRAHVKTTVSTYSAQCISRHYGIAKNSIHVIPNGVGNTFQYLEPTKEEAAGYIKKRYGISNFILYVSRIEPRKNHLMLLVAWLRLELYKQGIALVFIGKASVPVPHLQKAIAGLNPEQQQLFHWLPQVSKPDLPAFYRTCRLFVYPSKAEGFGIPPLEAAACGVPVLCSNTTAMRDFDFFQPYTFNPADGAEMEYKLYQMLIDPPLLAYLEKVSQEAGTRYNWASSAALFHNLLTVNRL